MNIQNKLIEKMPEHLFKFLDTLTGSELQEINKLDKRLIARIYQAGAVYVINAGIEIVEEEKHNP